MVLRVIRMLAKKLQKSRSVCISSSEPTVDYASFLSPSPERSVINREFRRCLYISPLNELILPAIRSLRSLLKGLTKSLFSHVSIKPIKRQLTPRHNTVILHDRKVTRFNLCMGFVRSFSSDLRDRTKGSSFN